MPPLNYNAKWIRFTVKTESALRKVPVFHQKHYGNLCTHRMTDARIVNHHLYKSQVIWHYSRPFLFPLATKDMYYWLFCITDNWLVTCFIVCFCVSTYPIMTRYPRKWISNTPELKSVCYKIVMEWSKSFKNNKAFVSKHTYTESKLTKKVLKKQSQEEPWQWYLVNLT